jgi:molecular chaperone DnaJ
MKVKSGKSLSTCSTCQGVGEIRQVQRSAFGQIVNISTCPRCRGEGQTVPRGAACKTCDGVGKVKQSRTVEANVPAGVDSGMRVLIRGEGRPGELGGPSGDLVLVIFVEPHPFFKRNGADILLEYPISFIDAILGKKIPVPSINGTEIITVDPGTESGTIITVKKKGAPFPNSSQRGDFYIGLKVKFPPKLKKPVKQTLQRMKDEIDDSYVFRDAKELQRFLTSEN